MTDVTKFLLPRPQRIRIHRGFCDTSSFRSFSLEGPSSLEERSHLEAELHEIFHRSLTSARSGASAPIRLVVTPDALSSKNSEGYELTIGPVSISLRGATPRAIFWGLQTLWQLRQLCGSRLPCLQITDWPQFPWRGFSDDMSRRQISPLRDLEFTLRWLARFKINVYQPYIEDIIVLDKYPLVGKDSGRFTRDEIAQLVAAGRRFFIDIVPQFNSLSHQEHLLAVPEYHHWRYRGNPETLDPRNAEVRAFLRDVYEQLFTQFPSRYFHMGLDEARGLLDQPGLFLSHANWLAELVLAAGKTPIMWHDMFVPYEQRARGYSPQLLQHLHPSVILDVWLYRMPDPRVAFLDELVRYNRTFLVSPWIQSHLCGAARADAEQARLLVHAGQQHAGMLGVHNTTWNDHAITTDRALNWRGHAMAAALGWRGARSLEELQDAARACARLMHGLRAPADLALLDAAAEAGARVTTRHGGPALALPLRLAHTTSKTDVAHAIATRSVAHNLYQRLARLKARTPHNSDLLNHVLLGLRRLEVGACRTARAPQLRTAIQRTDIKRISALAAQDLRLLYALRAEHAAVYLHRYKAEGLEYLDYYYRSCLAALEDLPWQVARHRERHTQLCAHGFLPLDLTAVINSPPRDLAALLFGPVVFDNVPWLLLDPETHAGKSLIWTGSSLWPDYPREFVIPVNRAARSLHVLHGAYGEQHGSPGTYVLEFNDGSTQSIHLRPYKDCGDWWMPYGHTFGGGGALRLDPRRCRLACLTDPEFTQGHGLYHFFTLVRSRTPITRIIIKSGHADVSLIVAAITLQS